MRGYYICLSLLLASVVLARHGGFMTDALTTGAERLAAVIAVNDIEWVRPAVIEDIKHDPGIKALVEYVQNRIDSGGALAREDARAALKLWEDGDA